LRLSAQHSTHRVTAQHHPLDQTYFIRLQPALRARNGPLHQKRRSIKEAHSSWIEKRSFIECNQFNSETASELRKAFSVLGASNGCAPSCGKHFVRRASEFRFHLVHAEPLVRVFVLNAWNYNQLEECSTYQDDMKLHHELDRSLLTGLHQSRGSVAVSQDS
jgi:hypothetical protein